MQNYDRRLESAQLKRYGQDAGGKPIKEKIEYTWFKFVIFLILGAALIIYALKR